MKPIPLAVVLFMTAISLTAQETPDPEGAASAAEQDSRPAEAATPTTPTVQETPAAAATSPTATAQETLAPEPLVIRVGDNPDQIIRLRTRVRHTTVIQLPGRENILDFVVGDSEYWHLTGAANLAFLKPISEGVSTNVALVCESGRIYSFLVSEQPGPPHLVVRIASAAENDPRVSPTLHQPAFVARDQVAAYQQMAEQARQTAVAAQAEAEQQITTVRQEAEVEIDAARQEAAVEINSFRSDYPTRLKFPYRLQDKALRWPFLVQGMWHDGQFTYLRSNAQESPALYEIKDGKPALVAYDLTEDGLYVARHLLGDGWLQIGKERAQWKLERRELGP